MESDDAVKPTVTPSRRLNTAICCAVPMAVGLMMFLASPDAFLPSLFYGLMGWIFALLGKIIYAMIIVAPIVLGTLFIWLLKRTMNEVGSIASSRGSDILCGIVAGVSFQIGALFIDDNISGAYFRHAQFFVSIFLIVAIVEWAIALDGAKKGNQLFDQSKNRELTNAELVIASNRHQKHAGLFTIATAALGGFMLVAAYGADGKVDIGPAYISYEISGPERNRSDNAILADIEKAGSYRYGYRVWMVEHGPEAAAVLGDDGVLKISGDDNVFTCRRDKFGEMKFNKLGFGAGMSDLTKAIGLRLCNMRADELR